VKPNQELPRRETLPLTDTIREYADGFNRLADGLESGLAPMVTPSRLVALAGPLLNALHEAEQQAHRLSAFCVQPPRKPAA